MARYQLRPVGVYDTQAARRITPFDALAWKEYLRWLGQGNVCDPEPVVVRPQTPEQAAIEAEQLERKAIHGELYADAAIAALRQRTPAQVDAWIAANVTDLASARQVRILARVVALLAREHIRDS